MVTIHYTGGHDKCHSNEAMTIDPLELCVMTLHDKETFEIKIRLFFLLKCCFKSIGDKNSISHSPRLGFLFYFGCKAQNFVTHYLDHNVKLVIYVVMASYDR